MTDQSIGRDFVLSIFNDSPSVGSKSSSIKVKLIKSVIN